MADAYLGIDPGQTGGGLALVAGDDTWVWKMPAEADDIVRLIQEIADKHDVVEATLEWVHSMPGQGVSSTFAFGKNVGRLEAAVLSCDIPLHLVVPRKWQNSLGIDKPKTMPKEEWKRTLKAEAARRFPGIRVTRWNADALLLADYGRRVSRT